MRKNLPALSSKPRRPVKVLPMSMATTIIAASYESAVRKR
jgi:hypothetical protein